jgi:hypothetical protein
MEAGQLRRAVARRTLHFMRLAFVACILVLCACAPTAGAERAWRTGAWAEPHEGRVYVIEAARDIVTGEVDSARNEPPLTAEPGTSVQFAIEGRTLYVLDAAEVEHALTLVGSASKYSSDYSALGGGHYVKAVARDGQSITLEDGSRWDMDPLQHFAVAGWQADDLITIRRSTDDPAFAYEIDNTSQDDGSLANHRAR